MARTKPQMHYQCTNGHEFSIPLTYRRKKITCKCGQHAKRLIKKISHDENESYSRLNNNYTIIGDLEPFVSNSGEYIGSRKRWREHLKETNCIEMGQSDIKWSQEQRIKRALHPKKDETLRRDIIEQCKRRGIL